MERGWKYKSILSKMQQSLGGGGKVAWASWPGTCVGAQTVIHACSSLLVLLGSVLPPCCTFCYCVSRAHILNADQINAYSKVDISSHCLKININLIYVGPQAEIVLLGIFICLTFRFIFHYKSIFRAFSDRTCLNAPGINTFYSVF